MITVNLTKRFLSLLSLGVIFLILAWTIHISLTVFIFYNVFCAVLLVVDYFISNNQDFIVIKRLGDEKLSIYEKEEISFEVYNKRDSILHIQLKDEIPDFHFNVEKKIMQGIVMPHEKKLFRYFVVPTKRGIFSFKKLHIKYEGKLKFCSIIFKMDLTREYKVYPNLKNLRKYRLNLTKNPLLKQGEKTLKLKGKGTSFESLREYVTGDEYRKINWKATARSNKPIVNEYEPEKNQHVYAFIDAGRTMSYTIRGYRKLDMAVNTALVLADVVNQNGDKMGILQYNIKVNNMIMPSKGVEHRNKILEALYKIDHTNETSNYEEAFYHFKKKERHRSIIFIFTDFETEEEADNMLKALPIISTNHVVVIILMKNEGLVKIAFSNIKDKQDIFNKGVALELLEERRKIINLLNRKGVMCIECPPENLEFTAVNKYIQIKHKYS